MRLEFMDFEALTWFLDAINEPSSTDFELTIHAEWSSGKLVYCVIIPQEHKKMKILFPIPFRELRALVLFLEERRSDIMLDMENFGLLKVVLEWAEKMEILD